MNRTPRHHYTPQEITFLKSIIPGRTRGEISNLFFQQFNIVLTQPQIAYFCVKHGVYSGLTGLNNRVPIGSERVNVDGYTAIKIGNPAQWERKHRYLWKKAHGPIPEGHAVIFANGNRTDFSLENLLLVSFKEMAILNKRRLIQDAIEATKSGLQVARLMTARWKAKQRSKETQNITGFSNDQK